MEKSTKILLSSEYEHELSIIVTAITDGGFTIITDIQLDKDSNLNDFLDFLSQAAKKQIRTAYKSASITCGKSQETASSMAQRYADSVKTIYQLIEDKFQNQIKNEF